MSEGNKRAHTATGRPVGRPKGSTKHVTKTSLLFVLKNLQKDLDKAVEVIHNAIHGTDQAVALASAKWLIQNVVVVGKEYERPDVKDESDTHAGTSAPTPVVAFNFSKK